MSTPASPEGAEPESAPRSPGHYSEIAPGVPRYGQYAPPGYQAPGTQNDPSAQNNTNNNPAVPGQQNAVGQVFPATGPTPPATDPQRKVPAKITQAFVLILLAGAIMLVSTISLLFTFNSPELRSLLLQQLSDYPEFSTLDLDTSTLINTSMVIAVIFGLVAVGLYLLLAFKIRAGRNWARVLGTVLAALSLILLISFTPLALLQVGFGVLGIINCWLPVSRDYFKR